MLQKTTAPIKLSTSDFSDGAKWISLKRFYSPCWTCTGHFPPGDRCHIPESSQNCRKPERKKGCFRCIGPIKRRIEFQVTCALWCYRVPDSSIADGRCCQWLCRSSISAADFAACPGTSCDRGYDAAWRGTLYYKNSLSGKQWSLFLYGQEHISQDAIPDLYLSGHKQIARNSIC